MRGKKILPDDDFIRIWLQYHKDGKGYEDTAKEMGFAHVPNLHKRRRAIEDKYGTLPDLRKPHNLQLPVETNTSFPIYDRVVVFTDAHFWPGQFSDSYLILLQIVRAYKPQLIINNGDAFDGAKISRHGRIGWDQRPTVAEEILAVQTALNGIRASCPTAKRIWTWGNHDLRMDTRLAERATEFEGLHGFRLQDHFPDWPITVSVDLDGQWIIKHRYKGGIHASWNNVIHGGLNIVTGHTHRLNIRPFTDYRGTRYGIEAGTLSEAIYPQFDYCENNPRDWQPGFLIIDKGQPETVMVIDGKAKWRGTEWTA